MRNYRCREIVVWSLFLQRQRKKQNVGLKKLLCREVNVARRFTNQGENTLLTLEALQIKDIKPSINTKDEFRSRALFLISRKFITDIIRIKTAISWDIVYKNKGLQSYKYNTT